SGGVEGRVPSASLPRQPASPTAQRPCSSGLAERGQPTPAGAFTWDARGARMGTMSGPPSEVIAPRSHLVRVLEADLVGTARGCALRQLRARGGGETGIQR